MPGSEVSDCACRVCRNAPFIKEKGVRKQVYRLKQNSSWFRSAEHVGYVDFSPLVFLSFPPPPVFCFCFSVPFQISLSCSKSTDRCSPTFFLIVSLKSARLHAFHCISLHYMLVCLCTSAGGVRGVPLSRLALSWSNRCLPPLLVTASLANNFFHLSLS